MGDRGNIQVGGVFLCTHWRGSDIPAIVQNALAKRWRWHDQSYLTRIIYDELVKGEEGTETGFGISASIGDNEHAVCVVDAVNQEVRFESEDDNETDTGIYFRASFKDYIALSPEDVGRLGWLPRSLEYKRMRQEHATLPAHSDKNNY